MKRAMWIASALLTLGFSACDRSSSPAYTPGAPASPTASSADQEAGTTERTQTGAMGGVGTDACPIAAQADEIESVDVPDGAALVFRTNDPTEKSELREQLTEIASAQQQLASERTGESEVGTGQNVGNSVGRGPDVEGGTEGRTGFEGPGDDEQTGGWVQSATEARAEETVEGVQLVFTTDSDVDGLRSEVRERADELNERCTTMR
ncbi:MAG: hypothetical protein F9K40_18040 [Kofleriaceae bacterium]|nr:MAG: hypothetical protein F9K40_18040 [Kofleriaceae bacterium]MBZ0232134.1 hypothetical protein [Kofleriaceae bacterium]